MEFRYFHTSGVLSRVSMDENADPNYCETYDNRIGNFKRNNAILEDLFNHSDAVEISETEFQQRLDKLTG